MRVIFFLTFFTLIGSIGLKSQNTVKKVVLQAFWWDYRNDNYPAGWANYLTELAPRLKQLGIDAVWIPPCSKNESVNYVGYAPFDHYDLGDKYQKNSTKTKLGSKDELLRMIAVMHANGIEVIQDVVLNHTNSAGSSNGAGGQDPNSFSMANSNGYKNFRYVSYSTPASAETQSNYWNRKGRWPKNYTNFYPNPSNNCTTGDICSAFFGPDISYESSAFGLSSNITNGFNPAQSSNYMRNEARNWMMWFKKQTGADGFRWDAVKHFPTYVQEDLSYNVKNVLPDWAKGGQNMFNVGEYVGSKAELDAYVNNVAGSSGDKMMGAFDFNLRGFDPAGGLYGMVYGMGNFDMASLPAAQQNERVTYYPATNTYVHRTVPFVNNHDTFRPQVSANGNYTGWNTSSELSPHIHPDEPRLSAAYAVMMAMDGNPQIFFEDLFNIGSNGNRYNHDPKSATALPVRSDLENLIWCHQNLNFKAGAYQVPHASADYLIIARAGKAIIGITDNWNTWQNQWIYTGFSPGTVLKDYSGANGTATVTVDANGWAPINTPPVDPSLNIAGRRGYSVWAPVGMDGASYVPPRAVQTTQEWEMAADLGDSHVSSLMQGGNIPSGSTNFRTTGKIFVEAGKTVTYMLYPQNATKSLYIGVYNQSGTLLGSRSGTGTLTGTYTPTVNGWLTFKVRNSSKTNPAQNCWVNVTYTAPANISNANATARIGAAVWSGNGGTSEWFNAYNWEEGVMPDEDAEVIIPANAWPQPELQTPQKVKSLYFEEGAYLLTNNKITVERATVCPGSLMGSGRIENIDGTTLLEGQTTELTFYINPNPVTSASVLSIAGISISNEVLNVEVFSSEGKLLEHLTGTLAEINADLPAATSGLSQGIYWLRCTVNDDNTLLKFVVAH
jgi:alpha-amylase